MQKHILIHTVYNSNPATSSNKAHTDFVRVGFIASCTDLNPSNPGTGLDKFALRKRRNSHEHSAQTGVQNPAMIRTLSVWALLHLVPILTPPTPTRGWISLRSASVGISTNIRRKRGFRIPPERGNPDKVRVGFIASCTDSNPSNPDAGLDKFALRKRGNQHEHPA